MTTASVGVLCPDDATLPTQRHELDSDVSSDSIAVPSGDTAGIYIPPWTKKAEVMFFQKTGNGSATIPISVYLRLRGTTKWIVGETKANLDAETDDLWNYSIASPELYDRVAYYVTGSAGTFTFDAYVTFSAASGGGASASSGASGSVSTTPEYTETQILTAQTSSTSDPTLGTDGTALQDDTQDAFVVIVALTGVTNADAVIWGYSVGADTWEEIVTQEDIQGLSGRQFLVKIPDARGFYSRIFVQVENFTGTGGVDAHLNERTT